MGIIKKTKEVYQWAVDKGIAKECARSVLPEGLTSSIMLVNGTLRSWIHYIEVRTETGTQKEHTLIAKECAKVIAEIFPLI
ncbi:MAG: FAD-dependent thymidylate synthase, partial [Pseudomonadota bacterium]